MAEFDGRRVAAVFAADTAVKVASLALAELYCHIHKLAYACRIKTGEGIAFVNLVCIVAGKEFTGVVTREAEGHLR